jgi:hypothetical protein
MDLRYVDWPYGRTTTTIRVILLGLQKLVTHYYLGR